MNGFDIENKQLAIRKNDSAIPTADSYNPEIIQSSAITPQLKWENDVTSLVSSQIWLKQYGLKKNQLDGDSLIGQIGFQRQEEYNFLLKKPISSKYGHSTFLQHMRTDGKIYNVTVNKEKLKQIENRLNQAILLYKRRLQWLTSESRRIFGVIEEHCITLILDIKNLSPRAFDTYLCAVEKVIKEQISRLAKFNIIRCAETIEIFSPQCTPVSKDTLQSAIDWVWQLDRLAVTSASDTVEALIHATADPNNEAIYLFTEGSSSDNSREILKEKVRQSCRVPFHVVSYNCTKPETLSFLRTLSELTGGRYHAYGITMEIDSYEGLPLDTETNKANIVVRRKLYGGVPSGAGVRRDVLHIFEEIEEAQNILSQIQLVMSQLPDPKKSIEDQKVERDPFDASTRREENMSSAEWLQMFGLAARKLDFYDVLAGVSFRHCDGVVDVLHKPDNDEDNFEEQKNAVSQPKLINARYCDKFAHVRWKDGLLVHVQVTPEIHRMFEQRMEMALKSIERRVDWLRQGSRELFGTIVEEQIYILIDTSASMEPSIGFVKDRLFTLLQEQIRHKTCVNFVAFNSNAYPWKDRLVDVTEENLRSGWNWIKALTCFGTTNTLAALRFALSDRKTHAIYLLTDGRPDQIPETILSQVQLINKIPIHTISFNCADRDANNFLFQLARDSSGRFHIFSENGEQPDGPESWESEDIRLLKEEYAIGVANLEKIARLREECQRLSWTKSTHAKETKSNKLDSSSYPLKLSVDVMPTAEINRAHKHCRSLKKKKCHSAGCAGKSLLATTTTTFKANNTRSSLLRTLSNRRSISSKDENWLLPEHREILQRQNTRLDVLDMQKNREAQLQHKKRNKIMTDEKTMSVRRWLKKYGLHAQRMTILDALAPTVIHHKPKYVPILDKHVLAKVFDEIMPLAHASYRNKNSIKLVNPLAVDLVTYRGKLEKLLKKYVRKLNTLVWDGLPSAEVDKIRDVMDETDEAVELDYETHKVYALQALENSGWPISESDIILLEKEIQLARKYLRQATDLEKASREKPDSTAEVLTDIQQEQPEFEGFGQILEMHSQVEEKNTPLKNAPLANKETSKRLRKNSSSTAAPTTPKEVKVVLDSLRGQTVIARNQLDGLYYPGLVVQCINVRNALVQFKELSKDPQSIPTRFCIPIGGAVPRPLLRPKDPVLTRVYNTANRFICYAPGLLSSLENNSQALSTKYYSVKLYTGQKCSSLRSDIIKIGETRYNFLINNLKHKASTQPITLQSIVHENHESIPGDDENDRETHLKQERALLEQMKEDEVQRAHKQAKRDKKLLKEIQEQASQVSELKDKLEKQKEEMQRQIEELRRQNHAKHTTAVSTPRDVERPMSRIEDIQYSPFDEELASLRDTDNPTPAPHSPVKHLQDKDVNLEIGDEVLGRWLDDGWYYRCVIKEMLKNGSYKLEDSCGNCEVVWRDDIIQENSDEDILIKMGTTLVALHPSYSFSYAPAVALSVAGDLSVKIRFYDGIEARLPRLECYPIDEEKFENNVRFINDCEKRWIGQAVLARDDASGEFHLGIVKQRVGTGKQYIVEWSNGQRGVQESGYLFGAFSRRHNLQAGDRVLACADRRRLIYLPGWVISRQNESQKLSVKFIDGSSKSSVDPVHSFWLSPEFYDSAVAYWRSHSKSQKR